MCQLKYEEKNFYSYRIHQMESHVLLNTEIEEKEIYLKCVFGMRRRTDTILKKVNQFEIFNNTNLLQINCGIVLVKDGV